MQIAVTDKYVKTLQARLRQIDEAHRGLEVERESIQRVLKLHGIDIESKVDRVAQRPTPKRASRNGTNVSQSVLDYVRENDGCQTLDVVDAFENVKTSSKDPRRYMRSVVDTHVRRGKVRREPSGALHIIKTVGGIVSTARGKGAGGT